MGRLTSDPTIRTTQNGVCVGTCNLAVQRNYKDNEGNYGVDFINCVCYKNTAEFLGKYLKKGQQTALVGRIQTRNYDNQEGKKVYVTEVIIEELHPIWNKKNEEQTNETTLDTSIGSDLPF